MRRVDELIKDVADPALQAVDAEAGTETLFDCVMAPIAGMSSGVRLDGRMDQLRLDRTGHLHRTRTEAMSLNETSFFRDARVFETLKAEVLPRLIDARRKTRTLRVWSAGCSTGQEAYSLAMLLCEEGLNLEGWDVSVMGTDQSKMAIEAARRGVYKPLEVTEGPVEGMLAKYFQANAGLWEVSAQVRGMCSFECWNLCKAFPKLPVFDLVLMRNVLLYMDAECRGSVFKDVRRVMATDGFLVLGDLEQAEDSTASFDAEVVRGSYFYRPAASS